MTDVSRKLDPHSSAADTGPFRPHSRASLCRTDLADPKGIAMRIAAHPPHPHILTSHWLHRITTLILTSVAAALSIGTEKHGYSADKTSVPNIVLILADDQGYGDVGCFGGKGFATPNLDRLAREGCRFTNFHVAQAVCSASRAALLTGCYPNRIGIHGALGPSARHGIHDEETTIAEVLKQKGYATGMAGKWHLGHHPQFLPVRHGFDEYFGLPYSNDMWPYHPEAKPGTYPPLPLIEGDKVIDAEITPDEQRNLTTWYTERAVKFIERNKDRPFFFYLAHSMPHVPLFVSDKFQGKSQQGLYGDVMMEIDWSVGEVLKTLDKHNLTDNTLVIFTCDNGPWLSYGNHAGSAGPLREGKGTAWEGGTRVPCIMRLPGKIPAGTTSDADADDHRPAADDRPPRRRRPAAAQDRRPQRLAAARRAEGRDEPARGLLLLVRQQPVAGRHQRRRSLEAALAAHVPHAGRPTRRQGRHSRPSTSPARSSSRSCTI